VLDEVQVALNLIQKLQVRVSCLRVLAIFKVLMDFQGNLERFQYFFLDLAAFFDLLLQDLPEDKCLVTNHEYLERSKQMIERECISLLFIRNFESLSVKCGLEIHLSIVNCKVRVVVNGDIELHLVFDCIKLLT
jgi:hypothetical protein